MGKEKQGLQIVQVTHKKLDLYANRKEYVDPVYEIYNKKLMEELATQPFWDLFLDNISKGDRTFEFSNRKLEKEVDSRWVKAIENCMPAFKNIIDNPRLFIKEEIEIVNVAVAKQSTPDVIRHLTTHGNYIDEVTDDNVRPNHLMNKFKEDTWNTYENKFVYALLEKTNDFVRLRYDAIFAAEGDEYGAFLKVDTKASNKKDVFNIKLDVRVKENEEERLSDDEDSQNIYQRIAKLKQTLEYYMSSKFAKELSKYPRVRDPIVKTNAIQKNPNFKSCYILWVFLHNYKEVGYRIKIMEQDNKIDEKFEMDIYHSVFFNYMILKNYLADPNDRKIDFTRNYKQKVIAPKFLKKIVEEIVNNYDIETTEVRKILIEELTKQQLMEENEKERERIALEKIRNDNAKRRAESKIHSNDQKIKQLERARAIREEKAKRDAMEAARIAHERELQSGRQLYENEIKRFYEQRSKLRGLSEVKDA